MADFEPVELDFMYGGNTQTEGPKIIKTTEQIAAAHKQAKSEVDRHEAAVVELRKDLVSLGIAYKTATTKEGKSEILAEIELTKKNIIDETAAIKVLKSEIASMNKMPKASVLPDANQVAKTSMGYNGLNMSMQQIVRELPAATMGLNMFFLAISNNIPMATDAIKRARLENEALKASGASTVPVWKQLFSSIISWQTLMMVGITVVSMYGKEIVNAFSKGSEAAERAKEDAKKFNDAFAQAAADPLVKVNQLASEWNKLGDNLEEKKKFVDANKEAFRDLGVEVNNVKDAENLLVDNVDAFRQAMISKAMSVAAMQIATEKYQEYFKKMREAEKMSDTVSVTTSAGGQSLTGGGMAQTTTVKNRTKEDTTSAAEAIKKEGDALISESSKQNELYSQFLEKAGIKRIDKDKKQRETEKKEIYDAEKEITDLLVDLAQKRSELLNVAQEDSLQRRLEAIDLEKQAEIRKIEEKEAAIIAAYNKSNKSKKGFVPVTGLNEIDPNKALELGTAKAEIGVAYNAKSQNEVEKYQKELGNIYSRSADERVKIEEDYNAKIAKLMKEGFIVQALLLQKERDERLSDVSTKLIKETDLYKYATDKQLKLTKELNAKLLAEAKAKIEADKTLSSEDKDKLMSNIDEAKSNGAIDGIIVSLRNLKKAKEDAAAARSAGDTTGEAKASKDIQKYTSDLEKYGNEVLNYFDQVSSGILGIMNQLGLFTAEEAEAANQIVGMVSGAGDVAVGIATGNVSQIISGGLSLVSNAISFFDKKSKDIEKKQKNIEKTIDSLTAAYNRLQRAVEDALGTDVYDAQKSQIDNLRAQIEANEAWIAQEQRKKRKKRDKEAIADRKEQIEALKNQIDDITDTITESLAQTNASDLASQLSEALVTAFQNGESAAEAMGATVNDVLKNAVTNALKLQFLEKPMQDAVEQLAASMEDGQLSQDESKRFEDKIKAAGEQYYAMLAQYSDLFTGTASAKSGISADAAKMTEETGGALVSQIIAMRLNVAALLANSKSNLDTVGKVLASLEAIRVNTLPISEIRDTLNYLKLNGIKVN